MSADIPQSLSIQIIIVKLICYIVRGYPTGSTATRATFSYLDIDCKSFALGGPNNRVRGGRVKPKAGRQVGELTHGKDGDDEGHVKVTADEPYALNEGKRETATIDDQINSADGGRSSSREIKAPWQFAPNAQLTTSVSPREQTPAAS